jgi:hypothetical protein
MSSATCSTTPACPPGGSRHSPTSGRISRSSHSNSRSTSAGYRKAFHESDDPNRLVPIVVEPDDFMVLVSGDPLRTNAYGFTHNGYLGFPTAKKITLPHDWAERISKLRK